jgi:tetratricopeptide (TPR) repeat protein
MLLDDPRHSPVGKPAKFDFFEPAGSLVRAAPKETKMKRNLSLWLGLLAFALLPVFAQTPAPKGNTGKIHGNVIGPEGALRTSGTVSLSTDGGKNAKFSFPVSASGSYSGEATPGNYTIVFRAPETPADKMVDSIDGIKIMAGDDLTQDIDMTRKAFMDKLAPAERKQAEDFRKQNSEVRVLTNDLRTSGQDFKDADAARQTAKTTLGATASKDDIDAKEIEIKVGKYTEVESLMLKDTTAKADVSALWDELGQAQLGLAKTKGDAQKYEDAETSYKKALEVEASSKKPSPQNQGAAYSGLGEIYARTGKVPEATAAYDSAAKVNPPSAESYLANEAAIFANAGNGEAAAAAADKAILADPKAPLPYYLKGQGLIQKATIDAAGKMILPPGCAEAYQQYLALAPTGQYANDVKGILAESSQVHSSAFGSDNAGKKKKGK